MKVFQSLFMLACSICIMPGIYAQSLEKLEFNDDLGDVLLSQHFEKYSLSQDFYFDFDQLFKKNNRSISISWKVDHEEWLFELYENNIRSVGHFTVDAQTGKRSTSIEYITYQGVVNHIYPTRVTIAKGLMIGAIDFGDHVVYFEPASKYSTQFNNEIVVYRSEDVITENTFVCGVNSKRDEASQHLINESNRLNTSTGTTTCRKIQVAQAYDTGITTRYGNPAVSAWNATIWNVVNLFYTNQFAVDVEFEIIAETYNAPVPAPPFPNSISVYLNSFRAWGNGGGFGTLDYDIGNMWTTINVSGGGNFNVIGSVMAISGVCGSFRYQIFEDFVGPTTNPPTGNSLTLLAVLIAHEAGHNVGMFHNNPAGPNIMEPSININANGFSDRSIHYFENTAQTVSCYSSCTCIEIVQAIPTNCSNDGSTFDVSVTIEHDNTSGTFDLTMGTVNLNVAYGTNPQTVVLFGVSSSVSSITATDSNDPFCTFTTSVDLPAFPVIAGFVNAPPYCEDNLPGIQNLQAAFDESFGSIIIEMDGDVYSNNEQTAQIIDAGGNVIVNYPFGTFNSGVITVNSGSLLLSRGPYSVQVADWFGDGMGSTLCQATNGGPGDYEIRDGQGNIIRAASGLQAVTCSGNNAAMEETSGINPAIDFTTSGNYSGSGVTDAIPNDGQATFDASVLSPGRSFINYTYDTQIGCTVIQDTIDVYSIPILSLTSSICTTGNTEYESVVAVNLGIWNSVLSGEASSISISSGGIGNLSSTTISANGDITISNVPIAQSFTLTVGDGTENGGCQQSIFISPPTCSGTLFTIITNVFLGSIYNPGLQQMDTLLNWYHLLPGQDPLLSANPGAQFLGVPTIPGQPYNILPWNYFGIEGDTYGHISNNPMATQDYPNGVVDWILVSIREIDSLLSSEIWKCAALLMQDGSVDFGTTCPLPPLNPSLIYYIVLEHRNHLPIMSPNLSVIGNNLSFDFTTNQSWILQPSPGFFIGEGQMLVAGRFVMFPGNSNQIPGDSNRRDINSSDNSEWLFENGNRFEYLNPDFNLDADVNATDDHLWIGTNGVRTFIPF